ncbi:hypothetical protein BD560DRAFT_429204 [Blakeslea trispora]|nr:hypothetical protein BD560DRAFT_429204 [Blakeslea trispora]
MEDTQFTVRLEFRMLLSNNMISKSQLLGNKVRAAPMEWFQHFPTESYSRYIQLIYSRMKEIAARIKGNETAENLTTAAIFSYVLSSQLRKPPGLFAYPDNKRSRKPEVKNGSDICLLRCSHLYFEEYFFHLPTNFFASENIGPDTRLLLRFLSDYQSQLSLLVKTPNISPLSPRQDMSMRWHLLLPFYDPSNKPCDLINSGSDRKWANFWWSKHFIQYCENKSFSRKSVLQFQREVLFFLSVFKNASYKLINQFYRVQRGLILRD